MAAHSERAMARATGPGAVSARRALTAGLTGFIALKVAFLVALALNTQYLMDEYAIASEVPLLERGPYQDYWPSRTLLYAYFFRLAFWLGGDSVEVMSIARVQALALALASLALLYGLARSIGRGRLEALLVLALALAVSSHMEWAFMVRPEPLALVFALAGLWTAAARPGRLGAVFVAGLFAGAAFLSTQKAVYFDLALGLGLVGERLLHRRVGPAIAVGGLLVLGWAVMLAAYVGWFALAGAAPGEVLHRVLLGPPVDNALYGHEVYEDLRTFVWVSLARNVAVYALCALGWLLALISLRRRAAGERIALVFTAVIATLVFGVHGAPWPYNFVLAIPFLALWGPLALEPVRRASVPTRALALAAVAAVLGLSVPRNVAYLGHDNALQNATVRQAERLLGPQDNYLDGVFMVVTRPHAPRIWLQRSALLRILDEAERGEFPLIERILAARPKVWILSYRTDTIAHVLRPYWERSYVRVAPNLLLAGLRLEPGREAAFETRWPGPYRLYDAEGRPSPAALRLDGRAAAGPVHLAPGRHRVRAEADGPLYLLPADARVRIPDPMPDQRALFADAHSF